MKKWLPYITGGAVLAVLVLAVLLHKTPRQFDGRITFNPNDKIPYGAFAAYHFLPRQFPNSTVVTNRLAPESWKQLSPDSAGQALLIVNGYFNPTESDLARLAAFAQRGNAVFISCLQMNETAQLFFKVQQDNLYNPLALRQEYGVVSRHDSLVVTLDSRSFATPLQFGYPGIAFNNRFTNFDSLFSYPLGYTAADGLPNLLAMRSGRGNFFLHSAPITFTNFFLLYRHNHQYFEKLMSLLPARTTKVVWDEYFMLYKQSRNGKNKTTQKGLLSLLLSHQNFYIAFWLLMFVLGLYLLTEVKRRQRVIPAYSRPKNDTLEFVTTIGKLYYEKGDHKNLADKLTFFFLDYVRTKYKLPTGQLDASFVQHLALKTNLPAASLQELVTSLVNTKQSNTVSEEALLHYHQQLEYFYSKA